MAVFSCRPGWRSQLKFVCTFPSQAVMNKPRVLLADDKIDVIDALRSLLEGEVELVGVVHDGVALVQAAQELRPDVIVTDLSMPHMNGFEAVRRLKQDGIAARIIFLTEYQEPELVAE